MSLHLGILLAGFSIFILSAIFLFWNVVRRARIDDLSEAKGPLLPGVLYSVTGGMLPTKKETAYRHLPTYAAGIVYHLGSFLAFLWIVFHVLRIHMPDIAGRISMWILIFTGACGLGIFVKRIVASKLRRLSTPDDYFRNLLVTGFQFLTALSLVHIRCVNVLFVYAGVLFAYIPVGKLRHVIYFFIARFYLGVFYGKRGVWPPSRRNAWQNRNH